MKFGFAQLIPGAVALSLATVAAARATPAPGTITHRAPIVIRAGGTYSGNWRSDDPAIPAVSIQTTEPVIIDGASIASRGDGISGGDGDFHLTVRNVRAVGLQPKAGGATKGKFVNLGNFGSLIVEHNRIEHFSVAVRALNFGNGVNRTGQVVTVRFNIIRNIDGRVGDGRGGYVASPGQLGGSAIGLNTLRSARVDIGWNEIINQPYQSSSEDLISTFESSGTAAAPIDIHDNYIQGDMPTDPTLANAFTGCGIQVGDAPAKDDVGFTNVHDNAVVAIDNCGIGISAGHDQHVYNNRVISARFAPGAVLLNGLYRSPYGLWDYYNGPDPSKPVIPGPYWYNNSVHDNVENVVDRAGNVASDFVVNGNAQTRNNVNPFGHKATLKDESDERARWVVKRRTSPEPLGPLR